MESPIGNILKSSDVKLEGRFYLDINQNIPNSTNKKTATLSPPQVRIVEKQPEFAVVEVICGCGAKTRLRCEYADIQSAEQETDQKNNGENNNEN